MGAVGGGRCTGVGVTSTDYGQQARSRLISRRAFAAASTPATCRQHGGGGVGSVYRFPRFHVKRKNHTRLALYARALLINNLPTDKALSRQAKQRKWKMQIMPFLRFLPHTSRRHSTYLFIYISCISVSKTSKSTINLVKC